MKHQTQHQNYAKIDETVSWNWFLRMRQSLINWRMLNRFFDIFKIHAGKGLVLNQANIYIFHFSYYLQFSISLIFGIIGVEIHSPSVLVPEHAATRGAALRAAYKTNPSVKCIARSMVPEFSYRQFFASFGSNEFTSVVGAVDSLPSHHTAFIQRNSTIQVSSNCNNL